jgi:hypothetical protein
LVDANNGAEALRALAHKALAEALEGLFGAALARA